MKTYAVPTASTKFNFNMKIHMSEGMALKAKLAAMKATKARAAATPKVKFSMKIHLPAAAEKALKAEIFAKLTTKAIAKDIEKAVTKDTKKQTAMDPKKETSQDGNEGRNEGQEVLDMLIENLDLVKRDPSNTGVSTKAMSKIEKKLSDLQV